MAAFSSSSSSFQQHNHNFLLQSSSAVQQQQYLTSYYSSSPSSSTINKMCVGLFEEPRSSQFFHFDRQISTKSSDPGVIINTKGYNYLGVTANKNSTYNNNNATVDSSSIVTDNINKYHCGNSTTVQQKRDSSMDKKRKSNEGSSSNSAQSKGVRALKEKKQKKVKDGEENKKNKSKELKKAAATGYIHVRARRGQATDSHSLAERVRREKISERMKQLQALVPGCEKVTGKALMLDEIINYVQSLQNQVEFLSMKLASINPIFYDFGMDLESFMIRPDQDLHNLPSTLQGSQQMSPTLTANHYPIFMDNSANSLLLHHAHVSSNALPQDHRQVLWEVNDQRYKIMNQSGVSNSGLFSFN